MSLTKLKDSDYKSAKVCICVSSILVVYLFYSGFFCFLSNLTEPERVKGQASSSPFIPLATPTGLKLHPKTEVYYAVQLCSATHKIEFLR